MTDSHPSLVIRGARLRDRVPLQDIAITDGRISWVGRDFAGRGREEIDAAGCLVVPAFIDTHIHLDKVLIGSDLEPHDGTLASAIESIWKRKRQYTVDDVADRACQIIEEGVKSGTTRFRSHVDVDSIGGLIPVKGVAAARERCADIAQVQLVAFPQEGIERDPATKRLLYEAMENGCDIVGGMPHWEDSPEASRRHIDLCFEVARQYDADIDMHVDETDDGSIRTLEMLADATIANGWEGRVTAGHVCAMAAWPDDYTSSVIDKVRAAAIHIVSNPVTNLVIQGRNDHQPVRRGITRVRELLDAGINVSFGQDCVMDGFYPFGRADMLEVALISAHAAHLTTEMEVEKVFDMIGKCPACCWHIEDYELAGGARADLIILDAASAREAIRLQANSCYVLHHGRIVAETKTESVLRRA